MKKLPYVAALGLAAPTLSLESLAGPDDWMDRLSYTRYDDEAALRRELIRRVRSLTGVVPAAEAVWVDGARHAAGVALDGVRFRLERGELVLLRPCAHCGTGLLASPPLRSPEDLGYALLAWQPLHGDCQPDDE
ncbi:MAG: hypothetical protein OHK0015_38400 [Chloroflexi bacterium OHK40]